MTLYTADSVQRHVADGRLLLTDLPGRRLNQRQVVIEVENKAGLDVLTAPERYADDPLVDILLHWFTLPGYAVQVGASQKRRFNAAVQAFFDFLEIKSYPVTAKGESGELVPVPLPAHCFSDWLAHLKDTETDYNVWVRMSNLLKLLNRVLDKRYGKKAAHGYSERKLS